MEILDDEVLVADYLSHARAGGETDKVLETISHVARVLEELGVRVETRPTHGRPWGPLASRRHPQRRPA